MAPRMLRLDSLRACSLVAPTSLMAPDDGRCCCCRFVFFCIPAASLACAPQVLLAPTPP
jgi:hypothetical protein